MRLVAIMCAVLGMAAVARAQSLVFAGFDPGANSSVYAMVVQPDGKVLVSGAFTTLGGGGTGTTTRHHVGRLNADGPIDTSFNPAANGPIYAMALQPDGKILVGGDFRWLGAASDTPTNNRRGIGRLNADGSLDTSFNPGANSSVLASAVQADGKILVGGYFDALDDGDGTWPWASRSNIGRLNADGSLDTSFNPGADH